MVVYLLGLLIIVLELVCLASGLSLSEVEAIPSVWLAWKLALISIPITGTLGLILLARVSHCVHTAKALSLFGLLLGLGTSLFWISQVTLHKLGTHSVHGSMISGMALMSALLLISAALSSITARKSQTAGINAPAD